MKTQFVVAVQQRGENPVTPHTLADQLRNALRGNLGRVGQPAAEVTVRHMGEQDPTDEPTDALDALVREYGNTPLLGPGRTRQDVLRDIRALVPVVIAEQAPQSTAGTGVVVLGQQELKDALIAAHRAGQGCGRLIGTESWQKAMGYADTAVAVLLPTTEG